MEDLKLTELAPDDMAAVAALEASCFSAPWREEQLRMALEQPHFIVYGLKRQGRLVAYISLNLVAGEAEVLNIATSPEERRQGHARRLLRYALAGLPGGRAVLEVRVGNAPALALYRSFGFERVGVRRGYYHDTGEDALIMSLELTESSRDYPD